MRFTRNEDTWWQFFAAMSAPLAQHFDDIGGTPSELAQLLFSTPIDGHRSRLYVADDIYKSFDAHITLSYMFSRRPRLLSLSTEENFIDFLP